MNGGPTGRPTPRRWSGAPIPHHLTVHPAGLRRRRRSVPSMISAKASIRRAALAVAVRNSPADKPVRVIATSIACHPSNRREPASASGKAARPDVYGPDASDILAVWTGDRVPTCIRPRDAAFVRRGPLWSQGIGSRTLTRARSAFRPVCPIPPSRSSSITSADRSHPPATSDRSADQAVAGASYTPPPA